MGSKSVPYGKCVLEREISLCNAVYSIMWDVPFIFDIILSVGLLIRYDYKNAILGTV